MFCILIIISLKFVSKGSIDNNLALVKIVAWLHIGDKPVSEPMLTRFTYRQVSNIRRTLVGNWIVDHSDVVGASPVGAAPTTSSFST